jgi:hypothetical protein
MRKSIHVIAALAAGLVLVAASDADASSHKKAAKAAPKSCPALNAIDPDNDGAMTLIEAKRRALVVFAKINPDGDRTLEHAEVKGRLSKAQFAAADVLRKDGKLSRLEWLHLTKSLFRLSNTDGDRTIECNELAKGPGKTLYLMLR